MGREFVYRYFSCDCTSDVDQSIVNGGGNRGIRDHTEYTRLNWAQALVTLSCAPTMYMQHNLLVCLKQQKTNRNKLTHYRGKHYMHNELRALFVSCFVSFSFLG